MSNERFIKRATRKRVLIVGLAVSAVLAWAVVSVADSPGRGSWGPRGRGAGGGPCSEDWAPGGGRGQAGGLAGQVLEQAADLELSESQLERLAEIRDASAGTQRPLTKQVARAQHALRGLMLEDEPDRGAVIGAVETLGAARTQLRVQVWEERLAVREILTEEQMSALRAGRARRGPSESRGRSGRGAEQRPQSGGW